ncbi:MAG: ADP-ribosylglycohydrolase family protein [Candidatus Phocaeicola excrementipullorum]|uniref:ADP-ribosylglycohydrolase family protein n=1 Tax=Candidatus Phocaeicola excrementipullorum TaxID=2838731 RepID=A0A948TPE8_9BACT|nr:ADP-ribosylglycohydrolase family protein [Candidatus Phocaeicola excrementipullorum]
MSNLLKDKFKGTLFGQAIGDALGLGTEFMTKAEVKRYYPDGLADYSQIVQDCHRARWRKGDWTDDTDMTMCIVQAIIDDRELRPLSVARNFKQWFRHVPMGIGRHTCNVLSIGDYTEKPEMVAEKVWEMSGKRSAANGGVMRTSVIGLLGENVEKYAAEICRLTHADPRCVGSCAIVSLMVHSLVYKDEILPIETLVKIGNRYDKRIEPYLRMSWENSLDALVLDDESTMGYTLKTMSAGLWSLYHCSSFEDGLLAVANAGGDADTNGAVAGSLLGARFGYENIPERFIKGLARGNVLEEKAESLLSVLRN